ncbi:MAG: Fic family protein [bacterium]|nr:Fic family protein [bacterium]
MNTYMPPFKITPKILYLCVEITTITGRLEGMNLPLPKILLRKENKIKTIHGTVAIEGNSLTVEQITAIIEEKPVVGPEREITEVKNALAAYNLINSFNIYSKKDFCRAHLLLMKDLLPDAGKFRKASVAIMKNDMVSHIAPPAHLVPGHMKNLFSFLENNNEFHPLIKASVFHYEVEFIHPFKDGNGRIGRLWEHAILINWNPIFEALPLENIVKEKQQDYYKWLELADNKGSCEDFIEFSLASILEALTGFYAKLKPAPPTPRERLVLAKEKLGKAWFSRKDYIQVFKTISTATAGRDLQLGTKSGLLNRSGDKRTALYSFRS